MEYTGQLSQKDRIVVVMGPTGAGKSTFIDYATSRNGGTIGHGLKSYTAVIRPVEVKHPSNGHSVVFIDTPGFDDTYKSDIEILSMIAEWLVNTYRGQVKITTILYLHRVTDNRMAGSATKNLRLFVDMCGQKAMPHVIIVTTMWKEVSEADGIRREKQLKSEFWNDLLAAGCQVARFQDTRDSAWSILYGLTEREKPGAYFQISSEMVDFRRRLNETTAGVTLSKELEKLVKERKDASRRIQNQAQTQVNKVTVEQLNREQQEIEEKIRLTLAQLETLKIPITRKVRNFFTFIRHD